MVVRGVRASQRELSSSSSVEFGHAAGAVELHLMSCGIARVKASGMVRICISWGARGVLPPDFGWPDSKEVQ